MKEELSKEAKEALEALKSSDGRKALAEAIKNGGWGTYNGITIHASIKPKQAPPKPKPIDWEKVKEGVAKLDEWLTNLKEAVNAEWETRIWWELQGVKDFFTSLEKATEQYVDYEDYMMRWGDEDKEEEE